MRMKSITLLAFFIALLVAVPFTQGCSTIASYFLYKWIEDEFSEDREEPIVKSIFVDREEVHVGDSVVLEVEAEDNQDSQSELEYFWVASAGTLVNPTDRITVWNAPGEPGTVSISILVTDTDDNEASATVEIEVIY